MNILTNILKKTEIVLMLSIVLGLLVSLNTSSLRIIIDYALGVVMFFSIRPFFKHEFNLREKIRPILLSLAFNYVLLSGLFIVLASIFFEIFSPYHIGFILVAIVPPAISIVPLCYLTHCDPETADSSLFVAFILSLVLLPLTLVLLFKQSIDIMVLGRIILIIFIIPLILAYLLRNVHHKIFDYTKIISNIGIGIVLFIAISMNRQAFLVFNNDTWKIYFIVLVSIFGSGLAAYYITKRFFSLPEAINFSLYASQKNEGTALAIAVTLFPAETIVPIIIALVCQFIYFMIFEKFVMSRLESETT